MILSLMILIHIPKKDNTNCCMRQIALLLIIHFPFLYLNNCWLQNYISRLLGLNNLYWYNECEELVQWYLLDLFNHNQPQNITKNLLVPTRNITSKSNSATSTQFKKYKRNILYQISVQKIQRDTYIIYKICEHYSHIYPMAYIPQNITIPFLTKILLFHYIPK